MKYIAIFLRKIGEFEKIEKKIDKKDKVIPVEVEKPKSKSESKKQDKTLKKTIKNVIDKIHLGKNRPNFVKVGEKTFNSKDEYLKFGHDGSFVVQLEAFSYQDKDKLVYFYDYDSGDLIALETLLRFGMKPKDLNHYTDGQTVKQLVSASKTPQQGNVLLYIAVLAPIACLIIGFILGHFLTPTTIIQQPINPIPSV